LEKVITREGDNDFGELYMYA